MPQCISLYYDGAKNCEGSENVHSVQANKSAYTALYMLTENTTLSQTMDFVPHGPVGIMNLWFSLVPLSLRVHREKVEDAAYAVNLCHS